MPKSITRKEQALHLSDEEKEMEEAIVGGKWTSAGDIEKNKVKASAKATLAKQKKEARTNIRFTMADLMAIRKQAEDERIPYQTLIAAVMHKYVTGQLVDRHTVDIMLEKLEGKKRA